MRLESRGDCKHLRRARHLEIQRNVQLGAQLLDVAILNVPTVFAQMRGDPVRTGEDARVRDRRRIRLIGLPRFANRRDMIDVDVQPLCAARLGCGRCWHGEIRVVTFAEATSSHDNYNNARSVT